MSTPLYEFQMSFSVTEQVQKHVKKTVSYFTLIESFSILGGADRIMRKNGEDNLGDADMMSEFYQAKQFQHLKIKKALNRESQALFKVYYDKLSFEFTLMVRSLALPSRFRFLQLVSTNARINDAPQKNGAEINWIIKYSNPQVLYLYFKDGRMFKDQL
jgi:hypothetical protein